MNDADHPIMKHPLFWSGSDLRTLNDMLLDYILDNVNLSNLVDDYCARHSIEGDNYWKLRELFGEYELVFVKLRNHTKENV